MADVLLAVGDMAGPPGSNRGSLPAVAVVERLLARHPGSRLLVLGDNAYDSGSESEYRDFYTPRWGQEAIKSVTRPCPGNHDYRTSRAAPYFRFFGALAGPSTVRGFYSFDHGSWHVVSLNTEEGFEPGSAQLRFLDADLSSHATMPTIAFFHRPRFGSGGHGDSDNPAAFWDVLFAHHVEIVLCGHAHHYERFAPQTPKQMPHPKGIRQFIVGTGGRELVEPKPPGRRRPNSEVADGRTFGVLVLTMTSTSYEWEFVPAGGGAFTDRSPGPQPINR
jgi:hypothetical protein